MSYNAWLLSTEAALSWKTWFLKIHSLQWEKKATGKQENECDFPKAVLKHTIQTQDGQVEIGFGCD